MPTVGDDTDGGDADDSPNEETRAGRVCGHGLWVRRAHGLAAGWTETRQALLGNVCDHVQVSNAGTSLLGEGWSSLSSDGRRLNLGSGVL